MKRGFFVLLAMVGLVLGTFFADNMTRHTPVTAGSVAPPQTIVFSPSVEPSAKVAVLDRVLKLAAPAVLRVATSSVSLPAVLLNTVEAVVEPARQSAPTETRMTEVLRVVERTVDVTREVESIERALPSAVSDPTPAAAPLTMPRWILGANVQGGVVATTGHATGYVAAFQWLKRGTSNDPRNLRYAFLSPAFFGAPNVKELGLLPISVNVATFVPHQPFTNVWVSPYVSLDWSPVALGVGAPSSATLKRVGIAVTATF